MTPYGYDEIVAILKNLADTRQLSHAYVFFGEPQVGKFLCAHALANYLEHRVFEEPTRPLQETLIVDIAAMRKSEEESAESIGIQAARDVTYFVRQKSAQSPYRLVIIRDAQWLTDQAQNALLKTLEEPPEGSVIILIATDTSIFLPAVSSRLQKIYFRTLSETEMNEYVKKILDPDSRSTGIDFCNKYDIMRDVNVVQNSFGRIGRLRALLIPTKRDKAIETIVTSIVAPRMNDAAREKVVDTILAFAQKSPTNLPTLCEVLLVVLREKKKYHAAAELARLMRNLQTLTLSKRIHLKKLLCLIT